MMNEFCEDCPDCGKTNCIENADDFDAIQCYNCGHKWFFNNGTGETHGDLDLAFISFGKPPFKQSTLHKQWVELQRVNRLPFVSAESNQSTIDVVAVRNAMDRRRRNTYIEDQNGNETLAELLRQNDNWQLAEAFMMIANVLGL